MPITKYQKGSIIDDLKKLLEKANILVFVNFHGLSVAKERKLRREFQKSEIRYKVAKKSLLRRALESLGYVDVPQLEGEISIAAGYDDVTVPPRVISNFIRAEGSLPAGRQGLKIIGGIYESKFVDDSVIKQLASIPSREVLLTQLAYILSQPTASFARILEEIRKKIELK